MDYYIGQILLVAFNWAPQGFLQCQGQLLPINQYQALFSLLGTIYGGDGVQTFALPDLRGRTPIGIGQGLGMPWGYPIGEAGGSQANTLTLQNLPTFISGSGTQHVTPSVNSTDPLLPTAQPGSSEPLNNMQPFLALNYIICVNGIYPSRP